MSNIKLKFEIVIFLWILIAATSFLDRADGQIGKDKAASGVFKVTISDKDFSAMDVIFLHDKDTIFVKPTFFSNPKGKVSKGEFKEENIRFDITLFKPKDKGENKGRIEATLNGKKMSDGKFIGIVLIDGKEVKWEASALPSIWACGNHQNPVHSATTEAQMRELTKKHNCQFWHPINSASAVAELVMPKKDEDKAKN